MSVNYYKDGKLTPIAGASNTDVNNAEITFTEAEQCTNIESGEKASTLFGKIKKWFSDLKTVAFSAKYGDLENAPKVTTSTAVTEEGFVADARTMNLTNPDSPLYLLNQSLAKLHGYSIYTSISQLGLDVNNITSLIEIIEAMPNYSFFTSNEGISTLFSKGLVPSVAGALEISRGVVGAYTYLTFRAANGSVPAIGLQKWSAYYGEQAKRLTDWIYTQDTTNVAYVAGDVINMLGSEITAGSVQNGSLWCVIHFSKAIQGNVTPNNITLTDLVIQNSNSTLFSLRTADAITDAGVTVSNVVKTSLCGLSVCLKKASGWGIDNCGVIIQVATSITIT